MTTLGSRVKAVIVHNKTTMTNFAKELNISQSMVSKICSDKATPSDRTISDICRIYSINKDWLVNGNGNMVYSPERAAEISEMIAAKSEHQTSPHFDNAMAHMIAGMSPLELEMLFDYLKHIISSSNALSEKTEQARLFEEGYMEGFRAAQRITEMVNNFPATPDE